jgi:hypothetical protein
VWRAFFDWIVHGDRGFRRRRPATRRTELIAARRNVSRQLEILRAGPVNRRDRTPQTAVLIEELNHVLARIDAELAHLSAREG